MHFEEHIFPNSDDDPPVETPSVFPDVPPLK